MRSDIIKYDGGHTSERSGSMEAIIALVISMIGYACCDIDFSMLYTFVSVTITLYKRWSVYFNDKATRR